MHEHAMSSLTISNNYLIYVNILQQLHDTMSSDQYITIYMHLIIITLIFYQCTSVSYDKRRNMNGNNTTESEIFPLTSTYLVAVIIFKSFCLVCGVLGNLGVIICNLYMNNNKTQSSYFVANLACADLLACLTIYPTWIAEFAMIVDGSESDQVFLCRFSATGFLLVFASTLTLLAITLDRYLFISYPLKYPLIMTWGRTYGILLSIWICALLYSSLFVVFTVPTKVRTICFAPIMIGLIGAVIYVFIPISLILYFNYKIFKVARSHVQRMQVADAAANNGTASTSFSSFRIKREIKTMKTFVIVVGVFLFCLFPFTIASFVQSFIGNHVPLSVTILLGDLAGVNSILNPIIYSMRHKEYRNCYRRLASVICSRLK